MKLKEAAEKGITRLYYVRDGKPVWNKYSFADIDVFEDGSYGMWMHIYDPCGKLACQRPAWEPIDFLTLPVVTQPSVDPEVDEFEPYTPPADVDRFPGYPPARGLIKRVKP
jgi:hypothetical protein